MRAARRQKLSLESDGQWTIVADGGDLETRRATALEEVEPARNRDYKLAYLISRYPAVSHTFIHREVVKLRELGLSVIVSSINRPDRALDKLPDCEREEVANVLYVKALPLWRILAAHVRTLLGRPLKYLRGLGTAVTTGTRDLRAFPNWVFYFAEAVVLGDWLREKQITHLHVHFATEVANVGFLVAKTFGVDLSITVHGADEFYNVDRYVLAQKVQAARFVCCIGYFARSQMMKLTDTSQWGKFQISPLGVDLQEFRPRPFRRSPEKIEVLCIGRLVPSKGQHILLRAVKHLVENGYPVRLRLVGDGPDRDSLRAFTEENQLTEHVQFEGAINQDRIRDFLQGADVFVLASFAEGIPVALMEAMATEVPCISTAITGIPELIRDGIDGLLVPASDEEELAKAIMKLIDNPELRLQLGTAGRKRVASKFRMDTNVKQLLKIFDTHVRQ